MCSLVEAQRQETPSLLFKLLTLNISLGAGVAGEAPQAGWRQCDRGPAQGVHLEDAQVRPGRARIRTRRAQED